MELPRLLLLQTGDVPAEAMLQENFDGLFLRMADFSGMQVNTVHVAKGQEPGKHQQYCGAIVTGSPANVTDGQDWIGRIALWLRSAIESGLPVLGICFGHQLVAHAFGGRVDYLPQGMELGTQRVCMRGNSASNPLLQDLPKSFFANMFHSQSVLEPPPEAQSLAFSDQDEHQILVYDDFALTLQFHPEIDSLTMQAFIDMQNSLAREQVEPTSPCLPVRETPVPRALLQKFVTSCARRA